MFCCYFEPISYLSRYQTQLLYNIERNQKKVKYRYYLYESRDASCRIHNKIVIFVTDNRKT